MTHVILYLTVCAGSVGQLYVFLNCIISLSQSHTSVKNIYHRVKNTPACTKHIYIYTPQLQPTVSQRDASMPRNTSPTPQDIGKKRAYACVYNKYRETQHAEFLYKRPAFFQTPPPPTSLSPAREYKNTEKRVKEGRSVFMQFASWVRVD